MAPTQAAVALSASPRQPQLDALRVFAMTGIFIHHLAIVTAGRFGELVGDLGLQLFFILSGFLTTAVLLKDRAISEAAHQNPWNALRQFYIRRCLRLFPAYYLVIAIGVIVNIDPVRRALPWLLTHSANLYMSRAEEWNVLGGFSHLWSLSVQEQFYVVWALVLLFAPRRALVPVTCILMAMGPVYRFSAMLQGVNWVTARCVTVSWLDTLGSGALLRLAMEHQSGRALDRFLNVWVLLGGIVVGAVLWWNTDAIPTVKYATFNVTVALVFCSLVRGAARGFPGFGGALLTLKPLVYIGRISYGLYLYHMLMPVVVGPLLRRLGIDYWYGGLLNLAVCSIAALLVASLSWHLIEAPISRFKQRFRPQLPRTA